MSAADLAQQLAEIRNRKPRPLAKLYGRSGPTPEQLAHWQAAMKEYNRTYRKLVKQHKEQLAIDNTAYRKNNP